MTSIATIPATPTIQKPVMPAKAVPSAVAAASNIAMGWDMLIGRFLMMIPVLALAGNLAQKKSVPPSPGTFPVNTPLFAILLVGVVLIVGALTFFPALSLGPILEHLLLQTGKVF